MSAPASTRTKSQKPEPSMPPHGRSEKGATADFLRELDATCVDVHEARNPPAGSTIHYERQRRLAPDASGPGNRPIGGKDPLDGTGCLHAQARHALRGVTLVIPEPLPGLAAALAKAPKPVWQHCRLPFTRTMMAHPSGVQPQRAPVLIGTISRGTHMRRPTCSGTSSLDRLPLASESCAA